MAVKSLPALAPSGSSYWLTTFPLGILAALGAVGWLDAVEALGSHLPIIDIRSDYVIGVFWAGLIFLLLVILPFKEKRHLLALWIIRSFVALVPMLLYEWNYIGGGLDSFGYYQEAVLGKFSPAALGAGNVGRLTLVISWITGPSFRAIVLVHSFIGLLGVYLFYQSTACYTGKRNPNLLYLLGLFPSVLFWSSTLGKEPIIFFGFGMCVLGVITWWKGKRGLTALSVVAAGILVVLNVRPWMAAVASVPLSFVVLRRTRSHSFRIIYVLCLSVLAVAVLKYSGLLSLQIIHDPLGLVNRNFQRWAYGGSGQILPEFSSLTDVLFFLPWGMFTVLFRPLPWEAHNIFALLAGLENFVLLAWTVIAVWRLQVSRLRDPIVLGLVLFVLVWAVLYSFISYQNLGSAARFKLQVLPFYILLLLSLGHRKSEFHILPACSAP